jgi:hypothetical protein
LTTTPLEAFEAPQSDKRSQAGIGMDLQVMEESILGPLCTLKIAVKARGKQHWETCWPSRMQLIVKLLQVQVQLLGINKGAKVLQ